MKVSWKDRRSIKVDNEKVYFFHKSLAGLNSQLQSVYNKQVSKSEDQAGLKCSDNLSCSSEYTTVDPVFQYFFNPSHEDKLTTQNLDDILDFHKPTEIDNTRAISYIDMALILGREIKALEFVEANNLDIDVISVINQRKKNPEICSEEVLYYKAHSNYSFLSLNSPSHLKEASNLTTCIADMLTTTMGKQYGVTELWKQGYHWDAFILCRLTSSAKFRGMFTALAMPSLGSRLAPLQLFCNSDTLGLKKANVCLSNVMGPILSYRSLKSAFVSFEKNTTSMDEKVSNRINIAAALQECIIIALSKGEYSACEEFLKDFFETIGEMDRSIEGDMFYGLEKVYFRKTVEFVSSLSELINHKLSNFKSKLLEDLPVSPNGLLATFLKHCIDSELYQPKSNEHRLAATKGILSKLYAIALKNNYKNIVLAIAMAYCLITSSECNLYKSVKQLGLSDEDAEHFITDLRSNFTNSNSDPDLSAIFLKVDQLLFSDECTVNLFTMVENQFGTNSSTTVLHLESILQNRTNEVTILEDLGKALPTVAEKTGESSRCSSVSGFNVPTGDSRNEPEGQQIYALTKERLRTVSSSSGRGSSLSAGKNNTDTSGRVSRETISYHGFRTGGFEKTCMHYGFEVSRA